MFWVNVMWVNVADEMAFRYTALVDCAVPSPKLEMVTFDIVTDSRVI